MLLLDPRAGSKPLKPFLEHYKLPVAETILPYGDLAWPGFGPGGLQMVGVEYKTLGDLLACIHDGRLAGHQLPGLLDEYQEYGEVWLLIEGMYRPASDGLLEQRHPTKPYWFACETGGRRWMYRELEGWLSTLQHQTRLLVKVVDNKDTAAQWIAVEYSWWAKCWSEHKSLRVFHRRRSPGMLLRKLDRRQPRDLARLVAKELPGIEWERSAPVVQKFGTVERMVQASEEEWRSVDGIGPTIAKRIHYAVTGRRTA